MADPRDPAALGWLREGAFAHRGLHGSEAPENSLAAFAAAMALGLGIECDLRKSLDGRAVVFHDEALDRLTGATGPVARRSVGELTALRLAGTQEHIPTLRDLLALVAGKAPLLLELKTSADRPPDPLCRAVRRDLEGYGGPVAVMSFDPRVVRWFAAKQPALPRGLVITEGNARTLSGGLRRRLMLSRTRPDFVAYDIADIAGPLARKLAQGPCPLLTWTVRNAAQLDQARDAGATPIIEGAGLAAYGARP